MINQTYFPKPWWQVGLAMLPGLLFLLAAPIPLVMTLIGLGLSSLWLAFKNLKHFEIPVWGLIPLGWFAFLIFALLPVSPDYYVTFLILVLISMPIAKYNGMSAGLFLLFGGTAVANWEVEPAIYFWDNPTWGFVINHGGIALLMIITPLWVLRSRTVLGQAMGLLFPLAAHITTFIYALSRVSGFKHMEWFQFSTTKAVSIAHPFIVQFVILVIASMAYAWIHSQAVRGSENQGQSKVDYG